MKTTQWKKKVLGKIHQRFEWMMLLLVALIVFLSLVWW